MTSISPTSTRGGRASRPCTTCDCARWHWKAPKFRVACPACCDVVRIAGKAGVGKPAPALHVRWCGGRVRGLGHGLGQTQGGTMRARAGRSGPGAGSAQTRAVLRIRIDTRSQEMTQGITCDKHRLRVEQAWTGKSRQADRHEQAWSKLGTRLDLVPLPMMEA